MTKEIWDEPAMLVMSRQNTHPAPDNIRPTWDEYFMQAAHLVSTRSTCLRRKVGAVAVRNKRMLCTGYNGAPSGLAHCRQVGCVRAEKNIPSGQRHELCRGLHAEQNVIIQAAVHGVVLTEADLYITTTPCSICAKMLVNCQIKRVMIPYGAVYNDSMAMDILKEGSIQVHFL